MHNKKSGKQSTDNLFREAYSLHQRQQTDAAQKLYRQILSIDRNHINALTLLSSIYLERGAHSEATRLLKRSLELYSEQPVAWCNLGLCHEKQQDLAQALTSYDRAIALQPQFAGALYNRGAVLRKLQRPTEALADYDRALAVQPDFYLAHNNRGNALTDLSRHKEAIASFSEALRLRPDFAEAWNNRGVCYWKTRQHTEAIANYARAIQLQPDYFSALLNLATALHDVHRYEEARQYLDKALQLQPDDAEAVALQFDIAARLCDWQHHDIHVNGIVKAIQEDRILPPFTALFAIDDATLQQRVAGNWAGSLQSTAMGKAEISPVSTERRRLRVAYLSGDFHEHPVALLLARVFELQDRQNFEYYALSCGPAIADPLRRRVQAAFEHFVDIADWPDQTVCSYLQDQDIDILVDLGGYTASGRPRITLSRPARLHVSFLGFPGTLGSHSVDYLLADMHVLPPALSAFFEEKIIHLPGSFMPNDPTRPIDRNPVSRRDEGLPESGFVFCCFNQAYKIAPDRFSAWMRILQQVPDSILWLSAGHAVAQANLRRAAIAHGIDSERLVFARRTERQDQHLARMQLADLFLDTAPYNAHTTACDALWSGLPLLTCTGNAYPARVATSLLHALDLPELVTSNLADYEKRAIELAHNPAELAAIRQKLWQNRDTASLFDAENFARKLERAFIAMQQRQEAGLPPAAIQLDA